MSTPVSCRELVGRADELRRLDSILGEVAAGRASTVLIGGDAGVGKSRLVGEFCTIGRGGGVHVVTGVCAPIEGGGLPYGAVIGILRDASAQFGDAAVGTVLDLLVRTPPAEDAGATPPHIHANARAAVDELAKTRMFTAILTCLTELAEHAPLVVVFDDLHWADASTAELVGFLTRNLTTSRVMIVGTYRADEIGRGHRLRAWLGELSRHPRVEQISLGGLGRDEMSQLITVILGRPPEWTLLDAIWTRSQGNAFFAEELIASRDGESLPAGLQDVIMTRVETLSADAQHVLRIAATIGARVDHELLGSVIALDSAALEPAPLVTATLDAALIECIDNQVLIVDAGRTGYEFRHNLVREAIDARLLPGERRRLHGQVARAIVASGPATLGSTRSAGHRSAELAGHWWAAGDWEATIGASTAAAAAASAVWAFPEALNHLERALAALDRVSTSTGGGSTDRALLLEQASDDAYLAGESDRAVELARAAIAATDPVVSPVRAAGIYTMLGRNLWGVGDSEGAFTAYRRAAELMPTDELSGELACILSEEARGLMLMSRFTDAAARARQAISVAQTVGSPGQEGHASNTLAVCVFHSGQIDEGIALMRKALLLAEESENPEDLNRAYGNLASILLDAGRLDEAASLVFDSAATGEELWGVRLEGAAANSAAALVRLGRFDEAEALLTQLSTRGFGACATGPEQNRLPIAVRRGRFDEAVQHLARIDDFTAQLSEVQQRGMYHMLAAELALEQQRPADAYEEIERALALAAVTEDTVYRPEMYALAVRSLADNYEARSKDRRFDADKARLQATGFTDDAERMIEAAHDRGADAPHRSVAFVATARAELSRLHRSDPELWRAAAEQWERAREPYNIAYCRWREAEALLERRQERGRADESLQAAYLTCTQLGLGPMGARIERLARRARLSLHEHEDHPPTPELALVDSFGLTLREIEVLRQVAGGRTDREIAELLYISKKTASVHVSNLLRKLDVSSRIEAGRIWQANEP